MQKEFVLIDDTEAPTFKEEDCPYRMGENGTVYLSRFTGFPYKQQVQLLDGLEHREITSPDFNASYIPRDIKFILSGDLQLAQKLKYYVESVEIPPLAGRSSWESDLEILSKYSLIFATRYSKVHIDVHIDREVLEAFAECTKMNQVLHPLEIFRATSILVQKATPGDHLTKAHVEAAYNV